MNECMHVTSRNMKEKLFHRLKDCIFVLLAAGWSSGCHNAMEFSSRYDHSQGSWPTFERDCILFQYVMVVVIVKKVLLVTKSRIYLTPFHFIN
jgi:hypothetical protein